MSGTYKQDRNRQKSFDKGETVKSISVRTLLLVHITAALLWRSAVGKPAGRKPCREAGRAPGTPDHRERGDVPGWVMITLMSAVLVAALLALAGPALEGLFNQAMQKVGQ